MIGLNRTMTTVTSADEDGAEPHHLPHDRPAALAEGPAMRERSAELLLERQEEAGCQGERGEPHRRDRGELLRPADGDRADLEEREGGEAGDQQRDSDGNGALGERCTRPRLGVVEDTAARSYRRSLRATSRRRTCMR